MNESAAFDFTLDTTSPGTFTNAVSIASVSPTDINSANDSASASVAVRTPVADLVIVKGASPAEAVVGDAVTYTVTVLNRGPDTVRGVYVTDTGAEGVSVVGTSATQGTVDTAGRRWDVGTLAADESAALIINAQLDTAGTKVNLATVDAPLLEDPTPDDNESSATVTTLAPAVDVGVTKSVARPDGTGSVDDIPVGEDAVFTITATNNAVAGQTATTATGVVLADVLSEGLTFVSATGDGTFDADTGTWTVGSLPVGTTVTLTIRATGTVVGQRANTASLATLDQRDVDPTNDSASATATFVELADLAITKSVDQPVAQPGDTVRYTIRVTNNGPNATDDTITEDPALIQANITGHTTDNGTFDEVNRIWTIPRLEPGETATLEVSIRIGDRASGSYRNLVAIQESVVEDPNPDNNVDDAVLFVPVADIAVSKAVDNAAPTLGETVTFTIGLRNLGPDTAEGVTVDDLLPPGLTYVDSTATVGTYDPVPGSWVIGDLDPVDLPDADDQARLRITARADQTGTFVNTATADRSDAFPYESDLSNNSASASVTVGQAPALELVKTASPSTVTAAGQQVTYSFRVTNTGNVTISGLAIVEESFTGSGDLPTPTCPAAATSLAPGASVTCTSVYTVTAADLSGSGLSNTARAGGRDPSGGAVDSPGDSALVEVNPPARGEPSIRTRTSDKRVRPQQRFHDRVRVSGLAAGTTVPGTARLYGPFSSRSAVTCTQENLARTLTWRARAGWSRTPSVRVQRPGVYTWRVTTEATAANRAGSSRCGLASETTTVAKPSYRAPVINGGFSGARTGREFARDARTVIRAAGIGLRAAVVPTAIKRGIMTLPANVRTTSWLGRSAGYGDKIGTTVIAGHVSDRRDDPGALWGLRRAARGQVVSVVRGGTTYRYKVAQTARYDRTRRLPDRYFRTTGAHRLVLISCTNRVVYGNGRFHYTKYQVVVARPIGPKDGQ